MKVAGIDVGHHSAKAVVMEDGQILSQAVTSVSVGGSVAAVEVLGKALRVANISREGIAHVVSTGHGRTHVSIAQESRPAATCLAKGIHWLLPSVRTAIDIGAEGCNIVGIDSSGRVIDMQENDKCAAGGGVFLEMMAKFFQLSPDDMAKAALKAEKPVQLSSQCVVFCEQELLTYIHSENPPAPEQLMAGVYHALAARLAGLAMRVRMTGEVSLSGGVAHSPAFVKAMEVALRIRLSVPGDPQMVLARGAALFAQESCLRGKK